MQKNLCSTRGKVTWIQRGLCFGPLCLKLCSSTCGEVLVLFKWLADLRWLRCSPDSIPGTALSLAKAKRQNCRALLTAHCGWGLRWDGTVPGDVLVAVGSRFSRQPCCNSWANGTPVDWRCLWEEPLDTGSWEAPHKVVYPGKNHIPQLKGFIFNISNKQGKRVSFFLLVEKITRRKMQ